MKGNIIFFLYIEIDFFFFKDGVLNDIKCTRHLDSTLNIILNYLNNEI